VKKLLATLAVLAGGTGVAAAPAHAALELGLMDPTYQASQPERFEADVRALRPKVLRYDLLWSVVARERPARPADPADPAYDWSSIDVLLQGAQRAGVKTVVTVWSTPSWAARFPAHRGPSGAPRVADWRAFVTAAATRYSGSYPDAAGGVLPRVQRWEIWNEANLHRYFRPQGRTVSPRLYTELLNAAYPVIKRVGAAHGFRQWVAGGSLYRSGVSGSVPPLVFLRGMQANGARFDVISAHPYNAKPALGIREGATGSMGNNIATGNFHNLVREVDRLWPRRGVRVWITEYGWKTWPDRAMGVRPALQASFMRDAVRLFRTRHKRVDLLVWFLIHDEPVRYSDGRPGWQTGLRFADGSPKPSFAAFARLAR
jgi:hypothetical protein